MITVSVCVVCLFLSSTLFDLMNEVPGEILAVPVTEGQRQSSRNAFSWPSPPQPRLKTYHAPSLVGLPYCSSDSSSIFLLSCFALLKRHRFEVWAQSSIKDGNPRLLFRKRLSMRHLRAGGLGNGPKNFSHRQHIYSEDLDGYVNKMHKVYIFS